MSGPTRFRMLAIATVIKISIINVFTFQYRFGEVLFPRNEFRSPTHRKKRVISSFLEKGGNKKNGQGVLPDRMRGLSSRQADVFAIRGQILQKPSAGGVRLGQSALRQGTLWRHSQSVRTRWHPRSHDLRCIEGGRWCDAAMETFRF